MKKNNVSIFSIILNLLFLLFVFASFFLQYESLFVTRIVAIVFAVVYLVIEIKKEYFSEKKMMFIIFSVLSLAALIVSILVDNISANSVTNERAFLIPVFVYLLIVSMYKDLYDKNK